MDFPQISWGVNFDILTTYERNLPHWRQEGAVYFVTFRLADSIPRKVIESWIEDRRVWLASHGITPRLTEGERTGRYHDIPEAQRRMFERDQARKLFVELDRCHGSCVLKDGKIAEIVAGALRHFDGTRLISGDFVVMPNHVHWLLVPLPGHTLEDTMQSVKRWSARQINLLLCRTGRLWQKENFDRIVRDPEEFERTRAYINDNPAKAKLKSGEFRYYHACWP